MDAKYFCAYCDCEKEFSSRQNLQLHKKNVHGIVEYPLTIRVTKFVEPCAGNGLKPPCFIKEPSDASVTEGKSHQFECQVSGNPRPSISWFKDDICIDDSTDYLITYNNDLCTLRLEEADTDHAGRYTCRAENQSGQVNCCAELQVISQLPSERPTFVVPLSNVVAPAGHEVCLECAFTGQPEPQVTWLHNSKSINETGNMKVFKELESSDGTKQLEIAKQSLASKISLSAIAQTVSKWPTFIMQCPNGTFMQQLPFQAIPENTDPIPSDVQKTLPSSKQLLHSENVSRKSNNDKHSTPIERVLETPFKCSYCGKCYGFRSNLKRHQSQAHKEILPEKPTSYLFSCHEEDCHLPAFRFASELRDHLTEKHDFKFLAEHFEFASEDDFQKWKENIEEDSMAFYVTNGGQKKKGSIAIRYYECHRSGKYKSKGRGKRFINESAKLGYNCTSTMKTVQNLKTGQITVIFQSRHYGHAFSFRHIRLAETERLNIAEKIKCKKNLKEVLDEIRRPDGDVPLKRLHFTTMRDIQNIVQSYNLKDYKRDDDKSSVEIMTDNCNEFNQDNPMLCCKFQRETLMEFDDNEAFFVIQHPLQKQILNKYGNNAICTDSTYGTNSSNFIVISLLVIDNFQQGFPVAWCIANRQDNTILKKFFEVIKENGNAGLEPRYFISDMEPAFFNAWSDVFGASAQKLISTYHLHKALSNQLQILISDRSLMEEVQKSLHDLIEEPNTDKFKNMLKAFVEGLDSCQGTEDFAEYFKNSYVSHAQEWAHCYRIRSGLTTANYMESFHKSLKDIYVNGRVNQRLDKLLHFLLYIAYNKVVDKMIRQEKGLLSNAMQKITKCHYSSLKLDLNSITPVPKTVGQYMVNSERKSNYVVDITTDPCKVNCNIKCLKCNVCIHQVKCTCAVFLTHSKICKHIHLACRLSETANTSTSQQSTTTSLDF